MLIVPIAKDTVQLKDGGLFKVVEYTNYKEGGPAVYVKSDVNKELILVYFFDIASINGTKVEYQKGSKVFHALGKIIRAQHLPQPDDSVIVKSHKSDEESSKKVIKVNNIKLKSKALGINKGMFIKGDDGDYFRLKNILDIDPSLGTGTFDRDAFLSIYKDYIGV